MIYWFYMVYEDYLNVSQQQYPYLKKYIDCYTLLWGTAAPMWMCPEPFCLLFVYLSFWYFHRVNGIVGFFFSAVERLIEKEPNLVNAKKSDGYTALHIAAINDHADTANILILKVSRIKVLITL